MHFPSQVQIQTDSTGTICWRCSNPLLKIYKITKILKKNCHLLRQLLLHFAAVFRSPAAHKLLASVTPLPGLQFQLAQAALTEGKTSSSFHGLDLTNSIRTQSIRSFSAARLSNQYLTRSSRHFRRTSSLLAYIVGVTPFFQLYTHMIHSCSPIRCAGILLRTFRPRKSSTL